MAFEISEEDRQKWLRSNRLIPAGLGNYDEEEEDEDFE